MRYAYPCKIERDEDGAFVVSFPDVRGANTGANDRAEALELAGDALALALSMYVAMREPVPVPGAALDGQEIVAVDPVTAAKLELYTAMRTQGVSKRALALRLGLSPAAVGRLTDLRNNSRIGHLARALGAVGRELVIESRSA
ncbi:MAG: type II toxin-antitoxin system HicB family antitoxin [Bryobacterales bacterium]|nr:type II toxin-antitoxin system HicB family antitoxin [Bryobacterales bacterium]